MADLIKFYWLFGDGSSSRERNPSHIYNAPGVYTVSCTAEDEYGNEYYFEREDYIYVYDISIGEDGLLSGVTDFCFRHAVKATQGQGIMPTGGLGWVWPYLTAGVTRGVGNMNESITLVIDSATMNIYRIGIPELWTDKTDTYEAQEIQCEAMLPEIESRYGPHENVRHIETHVSMRPYDEKDYRGKEGYDSEGFRNGHTLSLEAYSNGEQIVPTTKLRSVRRDGDYAFLKDLEAKRFQLKLKYSTSAFRTSVVSVHTQEIDHRTPPQLNDVPEKQWQREFAFPDVWFSRNRPTCLTNRADGEEWDGDYIVAAGPDGKSSSAFVSTGLEGTLGYTTENFTISGWMIGNGVLFSGDIAGVGTVTLSIIVGILTFEDGTDTVQYELPESNTWRHVAIVRNETSLKVYEGGGLRMVQELTAVRSYGGNCTIGNGSCFDIRRLPKAISDDAMEYYYEEVLDGGGAFLP